MEIKTKRGLDTGFRRYGIKDSCHRGQTVFHPVEKRDPVFFNTISYLWIFGFVLEIRI